MNWQDFSQLFGIKTQHFGLNLSLHQGYKIRILLLKYITLLSHQSLCEKA